ncbi:MAG: hypothetical protein H7328_01075 [Bdellovibrio sp.]|nr:hypothetical protein [Bdellovibrio sp.]
MNLIYLALAASLFAVAADARIRLRKVTEAPKVCDYMAEDKLLSRADKKVYSTERHSIVIEDTIALVKDKGEKICEWPLDEWAISAPVTSFKFYIDEYKEILYPFAKKDDGFVFTMKVAIANCQFSDKTNLEKFEKPVCEKPKKVSRKKKSKKAKAAKS